MGDRHALVGREGAHHRHDFGDMRIAVPINEGESEYAHCDGERRRRREVEEEALRGELADRIAVDGRARIVLVGGAPAVGAVDEPRAQEHEAPNASVGGCAGELARPEVVDGVRFFRRRPSKEGGTMDDGVDIAHGAGKGLGGGEVADDRFDGGERRERCRAGGVADERADLVAALLEAFCEATADFSGGTGEEDFHGGGGSAPPAARDWKNRTFPKRSSPLACFVAAGKESPVHARSPSSAPVGAHRSYLCEADGRRVALPQPDIEIVARFSGAGSVDVHVKGVATAARRKLLRRGQRSQTLRLRRGASLAVLGVTAGELSGKIVPLEDLWGATDAKRLCEQLAEATDDDARAAAFEGAIDGRRKPGMEASSASALALEAAKRLPRARVAAVAAALRVSERHLRRCFLETLGTSPKAYARLLRFHEALRVAQALPPMGWAEIAAMTGYYDQAHLIADFRALADASPRALVEELHRFGSF